MRVLYLTRDYTTHDYRFLTSLAGSGLEVYSLRLEKRPFLYEERPLPESVRQVDWAGGKSPLLNNGLLKLLPDLERVIREVKPDLIHAGPIPTAAFLASLSGFRPLVSMSWGSDILFEIDRDQDVMRAAKAALDETTILVCDCQAVVRRAEELGFSAGRAVVFPWGVDLAQFKPGSDGGLRGRLGWDESHFVLLSTRSWEPVYRVDVTVKGFAAAARTYPQLRLILLGGGSQDGLIRGLVDEFGLQEKVVFGERVGQEELPDYYRAADLYISSSHSDGSSVSLMEALACGRPALVSDIPGNAEWIEPGIQGSLFRDGDERDLREKLEAMIPKKEHLAEMGLAGRRLAEERADWNKNFIKLLRAYEMAVSA